MLKVCFEISQVSNFRANKDVINTVSKETGAKIHQIYIMEDPAESLEYVEAMKKNLRTIYENLN